MKPAKVWNTQQEMTIGFQNPMHFPKRFRRICNMFQNLMTDDSIKSVVRDLWHVCQIANPVEPFTLKLLPVERFTNGSVFFNNLSPAAAA